MSIDTAPDETLPVVATTVTDGSDGSATEPEPASPGDVTPREVAHWVYAFFYSKKVGLLLILALGLMSLFGALFQQAPDGVLSEPQAYASWLRQLQPKYGGWTQVLSTLGMFHVFSTLWFRATVVLLALSILACTTHRLPRLWQAATAPRVHVRDAFFDHSRLSADVTITATPSAALSRTSALLSKKGYRVLAEAEGAGLYADRHRWMPFGTAVAHAAFVVILGGMLVSSLAGFSDNEFTVTVGSTSEVGHGTGLSVGAEAFNAAYYEDGRPKDYASDLVLYKNGVEVRRQTIRVNEPLRYEGVSFYQSYFGTAAVITITDSAGRTLHSGGVPLQWTTDDQQNSYGRVLLADKGLEVYVIGVASGVKSAEIGPGQVAVEVYATGQSQVLGSKVLSQGTPATLGDVTLTFNRERAFTGLIASRDPGALLVWIGSALIVLGMMMTLFFRHHRIWVGVHAHPTQRGASVVRLASPDRQDLTFTTRFRGLAADLAASDASNRTTSAGRGRTRTKDADHA